MVLFSTARSVLFQACSLVFTKPVFRRKRKQGASVLQSSDVWRPVPMCLCYLFSACERPHVHSCTLRSRCICRCLSVMPLPLAAACAGLP